MIETIVITPIRPGYALLRGIYDNKLTGKTTLILKNKEVKTEYYTKDEEKNRFTYPFNETQTTFVIKYDPDLNDDKTKREIKFAEAIAMMPDVQIKGRKIKEEEYNVKKGYSPKFLMKYMNGISRQSAFSIIEKNEAVNKFLKMPLESQQEIAFSFGVNAFNHKQSELLNVLIGEKNDGILLRESSAGGKSNLERFMAYDATNATNKMTALMSKGSYKNLIRKTNFPKEKEGYYWGDESPYSGEFIGASIEDCLSYFAHAPKMMEFLENKMRTYDYLTDNDMIGVSRQPEFADRKETPSEKFEREFNEMKTEARILGVNPDAYASMPDLKKAMKKAREAAEVNQTDKN